MRIPHPVRSAKSSISGSVSSAVREDARSLGAVVFSVPFLFFSLAFSFDFFLLLVLLHARLLHLAICFTSGERKQPDMPTAISLAN